MSLSESIRQLEEQVRRTVESAMEGVRDQLLGHLQRQNEDLREQVRSLDVDLPDDLLSSDLLHSWLDEAIADRQPPTPPSGGAATLHRAARAIDQARSQSQVLQALLSHSEAFAGRAAVFLVQPGKLQGWGGRGFGDSDGALRQLSLAVTPGTGWALLLDGNGVVRLGSADRAGLASRLEAPVGQDAVLVPLVLRNRVAGALYADRTADQDSPLAVEGLQTLTYVTALALETLPLRDRPATATLQVAEERPESAAAEEPTEEPAAAPTEGRPAPPPAPVESSPPVPTEATPAAVTPTPAPPSPPVPEPAAEPEREAEPEAVSEEPTGLEDVEVEESAELEVGELEVEEPELEDAEEVELDVESEMSGYGDSATGLVAEDSVPSVTPEDVGVAEPPPAPEESETRTDVQQAGFQMEEDEATAETTAETAPPPAPSAPAPAESPASESPAAAQVAPPSDIQGPGWAFGGEGGEERDGDEEARHEEARRLARLLVSEIKLYNEDQVLEGRRSQDIFERLKEDIEKSRQLYESRVDDRVRESTDYFYQEMVRVLGAGDPKTLGI